MMRRPKRLAAVAASSYALLLVVMLLWPFDFSKPVLSVPNGATPAEHALVLSTAGIARATSGLDRLFKRLTNGSGLTVEARVRTASLDQEGPARIVSYSVDKRVRNFSLCQVGGGVVMRLRTVRSDLTGTIPELTVPDFFEAGVLQHIVVTYDFTDQHVYMDGREVARVAMPGGDFRNWDPEFSFTLANEGTGNRPWLGEIHLVAVYDRPLSAAEVARNHAAADETERTREGLVALFTPRAGAGRLIPDRSGAEPPLDLELPPVLEVRDRAFLSAPFREFTLTVVRGQQIVDYLINLAAFVPFGWAVCLALGRRRALTALILVLIAAAVFSLLIESVQYLTFSRDSSLSDVVNNVTGAAFGWLLWLASLRSSSATTSTGPRP